MKNKSLVELIKQDPKMLAKKCTKYFRRIPKPLEEELIEIFKDSKIRKHLKDKGVGEVDVSSNGFGEIRIQIVLSNDKISQKKVEEARNKIDSLLETLAEKMKESK